MEVVDVDEVVDVVQPGDKLNKVPGICDLIATPILLLFYPEMDEEILEIVQQKESATHIAFISKENLPLLGSTTVWVIKDDEQETFFKAFGVVGNNLKAAFWVNEGGEILSKIQQLTDMKFRLDHLIPGSDSGDKKPEMEDDTVNEDQEREEGVFPWKSEPIYRGGGILFLILLVVFLGYGYDYI